MACSNCGKTTVPCGCSDGPFTTVPGCPCPPDLNCPVPQKCVEKIDTACIYLKDYSLVDTGLPQNVSLEQIIQMFSLWFTNSGCIIPSSPCQAVPYIFPTQIGSNSIAVAWYASPTATMYQVEYWNINQAIPTLMPVQFTPTPNVAVMVNLLANSTYFVKVNTFCAAGNCYSVTLRINTKP
jgi:hypothetical protein